MIIGMGEIGKAVQAITGDTNTYDSKDGTVLEFDTNPEVLHICFPYTDNFVEQVDWYCKGVKPQHIIIWSTVPVGTTKQFAHAVHSPVEGVHPQLEDSIRFMERWVGFNGQEDWFFFIKFFQGLGLRTRGVINSDCTEALKLLSTTEYGVNLVFADYKKHVADEIGMDYELTKEWNREYNKLYRSLGMDKRYQKYVLDAPNGVLGGHCLKPNAKILHEQFPNTLVGLVDNMGDPS